MINIQRMYSMYRFSDVLFGSRLDLLKQNALHDTQSYRADMSYDRRELHAFHFSNHVFIHFGEGRVVGFF